MGPPPSAECVLEGRYNGCGVIVLYLSDSENGVRQENLVGSVIGENEKSALQRQLRKVQESLENMRRQLSTVQRIDADQLKPGLARGNTGELQPFADNLQRQP